MTDLRNPKAPWREVDFVRAVYDALDIPYSSRAPLHVPFPHPSAALLALDQLKADAKKVTEMRQLMRDIESDFHGKTILVSARFLAYCNDSEDAS